MGTLWGQFRRTALHRASLEGHMEILEKLLESGATVDFQDRVSKRAGIVWQAGGGSGLPLWVTA